MTFGWTAIIITTALSTSVVGILILFYKIGQDIQQVLWVIHTELFSIRKRMK